MRCWIRTANNNNHWSIKSRKVPWPMMIVFQILDVSNEINQSISKYHLSLLYNVYVCVFVCLTISRNAKAAFVILYAKRKHIYVARCQKWLWPSSLLSSSCLLSLLLLLLFSSLLLEDCLFLALLDATTIVTKYSCWT